MINEKRLDEIEVMVQKERANVIAFDKEDYRELIGLARLGLWARDIGVRELKRLLVIEHNRDCGFECMNEEEHLRSNHSLSALPKDTQK